MDEQAVQIKRLAALLDVSKALGSTLDLGVTVE